MDNDSKDLEVFGGGYTEKKVESFNGQDKLLAHDLVFNVSKEYPGKFRVTNFSNPFPHPTHNGRKAIKKINNAKRDIVDMRNIRRAKTTIRDIILCNRFSLFCTFTFNKNMVDRSNVREVKKAMERFFKRLRDKYDKSLKFDYVIVPELHADGVSVHFHALFSNYPGSLSIAVNKKTGKPVMQNGRNVFNVDDFHYGYSSAVLIEQSPTSHAKVAQYVTKYITKDMPTWQGKKRFWVSRGLNRPVKRINDVRFDGLSKSVRNLVRSKEEVFSSEELTIYDYYKSDLDRPFTF